MHREMWDLDNRVVKNFKTEGRDLPTGGYSLTIVTMDGAVLEHTEAPDRAEAERKLKALGYERVPPDVAFAIDEASRVRSGIKIP